MSKSEKPKMATSWEIYNRIIWDSRLNSDVFIAGFEDRVSTSGLREKPLAHWAADGDIPWHRIRYIRCQDIVVWDREQHLDLISTGNLPTFAWKSHQRDENLFNMSEKTAIFEKRPVYKYDMQGWQPIEDLSQSVKSNSLKIASFNMLCNLFHKEEIQTEKRLPAIIEHLRQCDADIIAIQEAIPALVELLLSQDWVRDYYISDSIAAETIQPFGNLLLSRLPFITVEHEFSNHKKALMGSWLINGELLQVAVVHLTSNRAKNAAEKRENQLNILLKYLQEQPGSYLIVGDFNTRNNLHEEFSNISDFIDIWQKLRPNEAGYTFNPQLNTLAELMSLEGEAARFDRILLHSQNSNWLADSVDLFACEPVENTDGKIFPSDHFGVKAVIRRRQENQPVLSLLTRRGERGGSALNSEVSNHNLNQIAPVYRSAIAIIPPDHLFPAIQAIRQIYDAKFERWMPHINLIYGFLPESYFDQAAEIIGLALTQIQPFKVTLNNFETFTHRKSSTAWLSPIPQPETALHELQAILQNLFPQCNEQSRKSHSGFTPHLSVGQFSTPEAALAQLPQWHPLSFTVESIVLISRRGDEPFEVRRTINLGAEKTISASTKFVNVINQLEPQLNQAQRIERDTVLEIVSQACQEYLGFQPSLNLLGSYRLGVESPQSDLDIVCQIPTYLSGENFLQSIQKSLEGLCDSTQLVLDAKVPLLRLKLAGISLDLLYSSIEDFELGIEHGTAKVAPITLYEKQNIKAILGCWEADLLTEFVSEYVPLDSFRLLLRAVRGWAKSRQIYGNSWGFLGGFSWALLSAWSCQYCDSSDTNPDKLFINFFQLLNQHDWHQPIALTDAGKQYSIQLPRDALPIITSIEPCQNTARNLTNSTAEILRLEFTRGKELTQDIIAGNFDWISLFESIDLQQESDIFLILKVIDNSPQELAKYCGHLEGYIISLILQLEELDIFVRPWNKINRGDNSAYTILGLTLPINYHISLIKDLAEEFLSQFNSTFEVSIVEDLEK